MTSDVAIPIRYKNPRLGLFTGVEFSEAPDASRAFFYCPTSGAEALGKYLTQTLGQTVTLQGLSNDQSVLIASSPQSRADLVHELKLEPQAEAAGKKFNAWRWRGGLNFAGQSMQLASGYLREGGLDAPRVLFSGSNLLASIINMTFGAQQNNDKHRLRFLKEHFNQILEAQVTDPALLPRPDDNRLALRTHKERREPAAEQFNHFMKEHSVRLGEMSLRYFASLALTFPVQRCKPALGALKAEGALSAFRTLRNPDNTNFYAGSIYLLGKTIGFFSKIEDPYNPKPPNKLDMLREKIFFPLSSMIETVAASTLAYGSFKNGKIIIAGQKRRDDIGGVGGVFLATSLATRTFATFGVRKVDMDELYAHLADGLALVPQTQRLQTTAQIAAEVEKQFQGEAPPFSIIYDRLAGEIAKRDPSAMTPQLAVEQDFPPQKRFSGSERPSSHAGRLERLAPALARG